MAKRRNSSPKKSSSGSWGSAIRYAAYRTMMDSAKGDPFKKAGVAMGFGRYNAGSYYLVKGFQKVKAMCQGKPVPEEERVDPYAAAGAAYGFGLIDDFNDIMDLAVDLDGMGAFDPPQPSRNRYAWRMNCEDGSGYGVNPEDYETRPEYNDALNRARGQTAPSPESTAGPSLDQQPLNYEKADDQAEFVICRVSRLDNGANQYYLCGDVPVRVGDKVTVPTEEGTVSGIVLSVECHTKLSFSEDLDSLEYILPDDV